MKQKTKETICEEDYQECWKCPRTKTNCMVGLISQNVVSVRRRYDIEKQISKLNKE